mmetsp:Transcript_22659/g.67066  ORF Transcript_22659/g.67066 Transcript_22659/m.67066 type:complete len:124 (+) Transcript_22659:1817-2188(+)
MGIPTNVNASAYGTKKAPPPYSYASAGKRHMLPNPTAAPIAAKRKAVRLLHNSLAVILLSFLLARCYLIICLSGLELVLGVGWGGKGFQLGIDGSRRYYVYSTATNPNEGETGGARCVRLVFM